MSHIPLNRQIQTQQQLVEISLLFFSSFRKKLNFSSKMAAALVGGVTFEAYSSLINYWLGPFPRPFMRPGLFKSLKDFLVDVEMKIEEKNAIRAIFQSAVKDRAVHDPLPFAKVKDFPDEVYKLIVEWMKRQEKEGRAGFFRQMFLDLRVTEKEMEAFRNRITQADQKLRPLVKVLKQGGRNLRKGLLTTAQAVQFIGKLPDWSKDKPFFKFALKYMQDHNLSEMDTDLLRTSFEELQTLPDPLLP